MNGAGRFGAGLLIGLLAASSFAVLRDSDEAATSTTSTTTTTTEAPVIAPPWFEEGEVMLGATAILTRELNVEDGIAFFDYDLTGLGPLLDFGHLDERPDYETPAGDFFALPERWVLTTASGQTVEGLTGPSDTSVRFELPASDDTVASIALVAWRMPVPFGERVELPIETGASDSVRRGTVAIETVLEQSISTIVQIDFDRAGDHWNVGVGLVPVDSRWRMSGRQGGGIQLVWDGEDAPSSVVLEDSGLEMRPVAGEIVIYENRIES